MLKLVFFFLVVSFPSAAQFYDDIEEVPISTAIDSRQKLEGNNKKQISLQAGIRIYAWATSSAAKLTTRDYFRPKLNSFRPKKFDETTSSTGNSEFRLSSPILKFKVNRRLYFKFATQLRIYERHRNLSDLILSQIGETDKSEMKFPKDIGPHNRMSINMVSFSDIGVSSSYRLLSTNKTSMFFNLGVHRYTTIAYSELGIYNLKGTIDINKDNVTFLKNSTGYIQATSVGDLSKTFNLANFFHNGPKGYGVDLSITYQTQKIQSSESFVFGIQLKDLGFISVNKDTISSANYKVDISNKEGLYFNSDLNNSTLSRPLDVLDRYPSLFEKKIGNQKVSRILLPKSLNLYVQFSKKRSIYAAVDAVINLNSNDKEFINSSGGIVTLGWVGERVILYVPVSYYELGGFAAGFGVRHRNFFVKSTSFLSSTLFRSRFIDFSAGGIFSIVR